MATPCVIVRNLAAYISRQASTHARFIPVASFAASRVSLRACAATWARPARAVSHLPEQGRQTRAVGSAIESPCRNRRAPWLTWFPAGSRQGAPRAGNRRRSRPGISDFPRQQLTPRTLPEFHSPCEFSRGADRSAARGRAVLGPPWRGLRADSGPQ